MASEYRVNRIEETGLSSSNCSYEQDLNLGHRADHGFVAPNTLHQLLPLPVETLEDKELLPLMKRFLVDFGLVVIEMFWT